MKKLKVTAVSYLNTKPLLYGLVQHPIEAQIELQLDIPSVCAQKLRTGAADIGLIPVAAITEVQDAYILSDYCIGTDGAVKTVCIYAERPIEKLERLYLDYHSRTSVELTRVLLEHYWHASPELIPAKPGYEQQIQGATGGLIIGDRTIGMEERFPYVYDLGTAWKQFTGLPFVFAAWVSRVPLAPELIADFNAALKLGIESIPKLMLLLPTPDPAFDLQAYFTHHIQYQLDAKKKEALQRFLAYLEPRLEQTQAPISFY